MGIKPLTIAMMLIIFAAKCVYSQNNQELKKQREYFNIAYASDNEYIKIEYYTKVIEIDSTDFAAYNLRGFAKHNLKRYDEALLDYGKAIYFSGNHYPYAHYYRSLIEIELGQFDKAMDDIIIALKSDPKHERYISVKQILESSNKSLVKQVEGDFNKQIEEARKEKIISDNVKTDVNAQLAVQKNEETGKTELNIVLEYKYEVIKTNIESQTDDFPSGKYKLGYSNAAVVTLNILKKTIETDLIKYLSKGKRVSFKITGSTDATPILNVIPYNDEFGKIDAENYVYNGNVSSISISKITGIRTNQELAFLRTMGVKDFITNYIDPLKYTKNDFQHIVVVSKEEGSQYRRIAIEIIIHDAFTDLYPEDLIENMKTEIGISAIVSDVDVDIPISTKKMDNTFVLIIGNEDYFSYQSGLNSEVNVDFAKNDAEIFKEYCIKTLGIPEKNVTLRINATSVQMKQAVTKLITIAEIKNGDAELIFYYSGHGLPNEMTKEPCIIPVDVSNANLNHAISLDTLYKDLTEYPTKRVTVFLDACFSGGARNKSLISEKGIRLKPKEPELPGNLVVFASSSGDESSTVYKEKQHGLFTYFVLKKLKDSKGDITYKELFDYLYENVRLESVNINEKKQTPQVFYSNSLNNIWNTLTFK